MNNQQMNVLWKEGRNGNVQFLSSWKRLAEENPSLYGLIKQQEGFETQDAEYSYKVGVSKFGLWLSRRKMDIKTNIPDMKAVENNPTKNISNGQDGIIDTNDLENRIAYLENELTKVKDWIQKVSQSAVMNL